MLLVLVVSKIGENNLFSVFYWYYQKISKNLRGVIFKIQPLKEPVNFQQYDLCTNFKSTPQEHVKSPKFWNFLDFIKILTHQDFFFKIQHFMWEKIVAGGINGLSINKDFEVKKFPKFQFFHVKNWNFFTSKSLLIAH